MSALGLHPTPDLAPRVADAVDRGEDLEQLGLFRAAVAEVLGDRRRDRVGVVDQDSFELGQVGTALFQAGIGVAQIGVPLDHEDPLGLVLDLGNVALLSCLSHGLLLVGRSFVPPIAPVNQASRPFVLESRPRAIAK